jgi:hypothetical protein
MRRSAVILPCITGLLIRVPPLTSQWGPAFFLFDGSRFYVPAPQEPETDGLSRNPDDCAKYGCIDNGGG